MENNGDINGIYNGKLDEKQHYEAKELAVEIIKVLDAKKAGDIKLLNIHGQSVIADYFVICGAQSTTQLKALADETEFKLKQKGVVPANVEGREGGWILIDYSSVIVHIFTRDAREFYKLEKLWADSVNVDISEYLMDGPNMG